MKIIETKTHDHIQVDDNDYIALSSYKWYKCRKHNGIYANAYIGGRLVQMHRFILGITDPTIQVDHRDNNGLNNQRNNLRACDNSSNGKNRRNYGASNYRGVHKDKNKWRAQIRIKGKSKHLGMFESEKDAAVAFNKAAIATGDSFYKLNEID